MYSQYKKDFTYENTKTEPNYKIQLNKKFFNEFSYKPRNKSPFETMQNKENISLNFSKSLYQKNKTIYNNDISPNKYFDKDYSFTFWNNPEKLFLNRKNKKVMNKSFNITENSFLTNTNQSTYENKCSFTTTKSFIKNDSKINNTKINDNLKHSNLTNDFKISKLLDNRNNKLKSKIDNLLNLALKNEKYNNKFFNFQNNIEGKNIHRMEMTIERIRNNNRKEIFKKKIGLNIPARRKINNNIKSKKKNLSKKLFDKISKSQLYKSTNYKNNAFYQEKRNRSFKNSFIYLNNDINYKNKSVTKNNSYKMILNTQNIYRPNSKIDYNKKIIEKEKSQPKMKNYNYKNDSKIKHRLTYLRADLNFFD